MLDAINHNPPRTRGGAAACVAALRRAETMRAQQRAFSGGDREDSRTASSSPSNQAGASAAPASPAHDKGFCGGPSDPDELPPVPPSTPEFDSHTHRHHAHITAVISTSGRQRRLCYSEADRPTDLRTPPSPPTPDVEATRALLTRFLDDDSRSSPPAPELIGTPRVAYNLDQTPSAPFANDSSRPFDGLSDIASRPRLTEDGFSPEWSKGSSVASASRGLSPVDELCRLDDLPTPQWAPRHPSFDEYRSVGQTL